MKKRLLSLSAMLVGAAMLVSMAIPMVQSRVAAGLRGDYVIDEDGTAIISYEGTGGSITIPDGIKTIGSGAFKGSAVTAVDLNEVTTIGNNAFSDSSLSSVSGIGGVAAIGGEAFARTELESFAIPKSLARLAGDAFDGDKSLTGFSGGSTIYPIYGGCVYSDRGKTLLIVPRGLNDSVTVWKKATSIAPGALKDCNKVTDIYIPATVKQFGSDGEVAEGAEQVALLPKKSTIYGYKGSQAQKYARQYGVTFVSVGDADGAAAEAELIAQTDDDDDDEYDDYDEYGDYVEFVEHGESKPRTVEKFDTQIDTDEQILQASAYDEVEEYTENEPVEIVEGSANTSSVIASSGSKKRTKNDPGSSSSSIVYSADSSYVELPERSYSDDVYSYSEDYDFGYYDELADNSSTGAGEVAARIVVPDETPISNNQNSSSQSSTSQTTGGTSDGLPVEGGGQSGSNNTVSDNGQSNSSNTVSDNGQNSSSNTVSDNGQNSSSGTVYDNGQQTDTTSAIVSDNGQVSSQTTADKVAHALDATPKTADLSVGAPFIFAAGLFMAGFSGMILTRRRSVPALSARYDNRDDELD